MPVKVGIVGAGFMGQIAHIDNYAQIESCRIVALAEVRPELRRRVALRYDIPRTYETHLDLLDDPEVEAVVAVTPRPQIGPIALDCLKAGKHLITEKPMAATLEQATVLVDAARVSGVRYSVGYMKRHDEGVQLAKQLLDEVVASGELGPIVYARAHCFMGDSYANAGGHIVTDEVPSGDRPVWPIAPEWVSEAREREYAWFLNVYVHNVNLLRYLLGRTPTVDFARLDREDGMVALLDFQDYTATLEAGRSSYHDWDEVTEVFFAHGRLRVVTPPALLRNMPAQVELYRGADGFETRVPQSGWTWAFRRQAEAFINDVRSDGDSLASGSDGLTDMKLVEDMWRLELNR
jgi:predicted dehydrogenase